jgi:hypothetical protein
MATAADITNLMGALSAIQTDAQNTRRELLEKVSDSEKSTANAMLAFQASHTALQDSITKLGTATDIKLAQLAADLRKWTTENFASSAEAADVPMSSSQAPAGEHVKRPRSAGPFERHGPRAGPATAAGLGEPTFAVWIGGFPRKLGVVLLEDAAKSICTAYLHSGTDYKTIVRGMRPGFKILFDDANDMKNFLQAFRASPHKWTDPVDAFSSTMLRASVDKTAADRVRISLMTCLWGIINPLLVGSGAWLADRHRLRSQGTSGILWVDNSVNNDGRELLSVRFASAGPADPTFEWQNDQATKFGLDAAQCISITTRSLADWRLKHAAD